MIKSIKKSVLDKILSNVKYKKDGQLIDIDNEDFYRFILLYFKFEVIDDV